MATPMITIRQMSSVVNRDAYTGKLVRFTILLTDTDEHIFDIRSVRYTLPQVIVVPPGAVASTIIEDSVQLLTIHTCPICSNPVFHNDEHYCLSADCNGAVSSDKLIAQLFTLHVDTDVYTEVMSKQLLEYVNTTGVMLPSNILVLLRFVQTSPTASDKLKVYVSNVLKYMPLHTFIDICGNGEIDKSLIPFGLNLSKLTSIVSSNRDVSAIKVSLISLGLDEKLLRYFSIMMFSNRREMIFLQTAAS